MNVASLVVRNIRRQPRNFFFSATGIVLGIAAFVFFIALGYGVKRNILDRIFVVNQVEFVPRTVSFGAFQRQGGLFGDSGTGIDDYMVDELRDFPGVEAVFPRQQLSFPALAMGGDSVFGESMVTELLADGIPAALVAESFGRGASGDLAFVDWRTDTACHEGRCPAGGRCVSGQCEAQTCVPADEVWACATRSDAAEVMRAAYNAAGRRRWRISIRELGDDSTVGEPFVVAVSGPSRAQIQRLLRARELPGRPLADGGPESGCTDEAAWCDPSTRSCALPVPVLASPTMLELYNGNFQSMMSGMAGSSRMPRLTEDALIGLGFESVLGRGYLGEATTVDDGDVAPREIKLRIVGFSDVAMPIGATIPLGYIQRWNVEYGGRGAGDEYHSLMIRSEDSQSLNRIIEHVQDEYGLELHPRYKQAQRAGSMITLVTGVFVLLSITILLLSALNIMHTFLMVVAQRRREIGVLRALGATRGVVYLLILGEALAIAVVGTVAALGLSIGAMALVDTLTQKQMPHVPFLPESLFAFPDWLLPAAFAVAALFCLLGAWLPALRAAQMDPAEAFRDGA